jgi:hypothetical protein
MKSFLTTCCARIFFWATLFCLVTNLAADAIDFTKGHNLKEVFDAGVQPWRLQGLEGSQCIVTNQEVSFLFTDSKPFSLNAQIATFKVLAGNELTGMDVISEVMPFQDAVNKTQEIYDDLGMDKKPLDDFIAGLGKVVYQRLYWGGHVQKDDQRIQVTFTPLATPNFDTAKVYVTVDFGPFGQPMKFLTGPIQPPPGYENVSMDPPPLTPSAHPFPGTRDSYYYINEAKQKGLDPLTSTPAQIEAAPWPAGKSPAVAPSPKPSNPLSLALASNPISSAYEWLFALLIFALGTWWVVRRRK